MYTEVDSTTAGVEDTGTEGGMDTEEEEEGTGMEAMDTGMGKIKR